MAIIFYYVLKENIKTIKTGINLSVYSDKHIPVGGKMVPCIMGLLSPRDDVEKSLSESYVCIELDVEPKNCYVLNGDLDFLDNKEIYYKSMIPLEKYTYGLYRRPEIAVLNNIDSLSITVSHNSIGTPVLFESSDKLYKYNLFEEFRQRYNDFDETLLGIFFMLMSHKGKFKQLGKKIVNNKTVYVYEENTSKKVYSIDVQEVIKNE